MGKTKETKLKYDLPHTYENPNAENEWYAKGKEEHARMKGEMFKRSRMKYQKEFYLMR